MGGPDAIAGIAAALIADAALAALIGDDQVFESVPERAREPYLVVGPARTRDWSTATERGDEVEVEVRLHGRAMRMRDADAVMERVRAAVVFDGVALPRGALVNLEPLTQSTRRRPADDRLEIVQRFRVVIEQD